MAQSPQCALSVRVSTQLCEQAFKPGRHSAEHAPPEQTSAALHVTPHPPQFLGSITVGVHVPPHCRWYAEQGDPALATALSGRELAPPSRVGESPEGPVPDGAVASTSDVGTLLG